MCKKMLNVFICGVLSALTGDASNSGALVPERFPRSIAFRSTENALIGGIYVVDQNLDFVDGPSGRELRVDITHELFAADMHRYPIVIGKVVQEEKKGTGAALAGYNYLKAAHPEKIVLAHFNGRNRRPEYQVGAERFFPGHYVYQVPNPVLNDVAAISTETVLQLDDVSSYMDGSGDLIKGMELCLYAVIGGQPDFSHSEYVFAVSVDETANTLTVSRGENASTPMAYAAGQVAIACALTHKKRFSYNFSPTCPKDPHGRTCNEALVDDLVELLEDGGKLEALDGIIFDAASVHAPNRAFDGKVDLDMDGHPEVGGFEGGVYLPLVGYMEFSKLLRERMGDEFLILGDSRTPGHHRSFAYYNGIESEGWPAKKDQQFAKRWSTGIARHQFVESHLQQPSFHHLHSIPDEPNLKRLFQVAAACLGAGFTGEYRSFVDTGEIVGHTDEMAKGIAFDFSGWLGQPIGQMRRLVDSETTDLSDGSYANLGFTATGDVTTTDITGQPVSKLSINTVSNPGTELYFKVRLMAEPMAGYDASMPRVCWMTATPSGSTKFSIDSATARELGQSPNAYTQELYVDADGETYGVYFRWMNKTHVDLEFVIEGHEPAILESVEIYDRPDVIYREFENGLVVGNPSLDAVTFNLSARFPSQSFRRINGSVNPTYNNGEQVGDSITIPALDGIFLVKGDAVDADSEF